MTAPIRRASACRLAFVRADSPPVPWNRRIARAARAWVRRCAGARITTLTPVRMPVRMPALMPVFALAVAGCTTAGPSFEPTPIEAPAQWAQQHGGPATLAAPQDDVSAWPADPWSVFGDPALARLQARARQAGPDVRSAALRLLQSRVQETTVSAQRGVQLAAQGAATRERQSEFGSASRLVSTIGGANQEPLLQALSSPFTLFQAGFDASWEPDLWGRVLRSEEAARAHTDVQRAELRQIRLSVSAELARAYFALRAAQRQQALAQDALDTGAQLEALLQAQVARGLIDDSALLAQRSQQASLQAALPALLAQEVQAINQISLLCGAAPGALNDDLQPRPADTPAPVWPDLQLGLPSALAQRRADVAAAEAQLHAATAGIGIAVADLYPRITLGASFGLESVGIGHVRDWDARQWSVGPSLSIPLWDHGRRQSVITLRELQQQEAAVAYQQTVLKAWHEVDGAIAAYVSETRRDVQFDARVHHAQDELALSRSRYDHGLTTYQPVLAARTRWLDAQRERSDSVQRVQTAWTALVKAMGDDGAPMPDGA